MVVLDAVLRVKTTQTPRNTSKAARLAPSQCIDVTLRRLLWEWTVPHRCAVADH